MARRSKTLVLVAAVAVVILTGCGSSESPTVGRAAEPTTTAPTITTTSATTAATTSPSSAPSAPECTAGALLDTAVEQEIAAADAEVTGFGCTPTSAGDFAGGYAWAELHAAGVDPLIVFFTAYTGETPTGGHHFGDWQVLTYGSDVFCEDRIPVEACDQLSPPRSTRTTNVPTSTPPGSTAPALPDGEFVGPVIGTDATTRTVTWQVRCGTTATGASMPTGEFALAVDASVVEVESNPSDPAAGHMITVPVTTWLASPAAGEWTVTVQHDAATAIRSASASSDHEPCR